MYNKSKNIILFAVFIIIILLITLILIFSVYRAKEKANVEEYKISLNNIAYDKQYSYVSLEKEAILKKEWDGNYYLYQNNRSLKYELGTEPVFYDITKNEVSIYGDVYQVFSNGEIAQKQGKTVIKSVSDFQFFKLNDRKYLIVGDSIKNENFSTTNYLIVTIDKAGNASFLNNSVNIKTINPLILSIENVKFDIANEKLIFGEKEIDLKKINGSTNEYVEEEIIEQKPENNDTNNSDNNSSDNNSNDKYNEIINQIINIGGLNNTSSNKTNLYKNVSLRTVGIGASYLDVAYSVIDPEDKYLSVFLSLEDENNNSEYYYLSKEATNYRISGLFPNKQYKLSINYIVHGSSNSITADSVVALTSSDPTSVRLTKIKGNTVTYKVKMYNEYEFYSANVVLTSCDGTEHLGINPLNIQNALSNDGDTGDFTITSDYLYEYVCLKLDSVKDINGNDITMNSYHKVKIK